MINKRSLEIIELLIDHERYNQPCTLVMLAKQFDVSERTLRYDLDNISNCLKEQGCKPLSYDEHGNICLNNIIKDVERIISKQDYYSMKLSREERAFVISYMIARVDEPLTMQNLADSLYVSRSTILHDMNVVKEVLQNFNLKLVSSKKGLLVKGRESDRRILLLNLFPKIYSNQLESVRDAEQQEVIEIVQTIIQSIEKKDSLFFTDESYNGLLTYITILLDESRKDRYVEIDYILRHPSMQLLASEILNTLSKKLNFEYSLTEEYLLSDILYNFNYLRRNDIDDQLIRIQISADNFINAVAKDLNLKIQKDFQFYQNLVDHLQSTFKDILLNPTNNNKLLQKIVIDHSDVVQSVKRNSSMLEEVIHRPITEEEIAYISIHICAAIERSKQRESSLHVLLVCDSNKSTAQLLLIKLKRYFRFKVVDVIPHHVVNVYDLSDIDLIITTVPIDKNSCETILLHPYLNDEDCILLGEKIDSIQVKKKNKGKDQTFLHLENIIANSIARSPLDKDEIYLNVVKDLQNIFSPELNDQLALYNLLRGHIQINVKAETWEDAVKKSAEPLLKEGYFNYVYIEQMIQNVYNNGPYIVIGPRFALPHETPNRGQKLGMNLIRLSKPINFGSELFDPVEFVCCLSTQDKESHLKPMFHILGLLRNNEFLKAIENAKTVSEMMRILHDYEQML
ncbi:BglG family transcription antiterminator [Absicoccus intestinalis]|uniref:BglG family transcription antiterminator n=1 Tax=Absicoccus intestinalis TaxID=2926319 RepID=A0ABU4WRQ4_9FIRM|nr:BglG family transcription antiterminator [Absicoccus sp. CLA-KB-P134]MDX8418137.1 BglG family transcription antiterminator [Absicoccus sp. CLA-KB-P134]